MCTIYVPYIYNKYVMCTRIFFTCVEQKIKPMKIDKIVIRNPIKTKETKENEKPKKILQRNESRENKERNKQNR